MGRIDRRLYSTRQEMSVRLVFRSNGARRRDFGAQTGTRGPRDAGAESERKTGVLSTGAFGSVPQPGMRQGLWRRAADT
jgi:hypothetical protein